VKGDGTVACWGMGGNGQLGDGMSTSSPTPVTATGFSGITAIGTGTGFQGETTCALKSDGTVWCWGLNNGGQVGDGTMTNAPSPVEVPGITTATAISVGANGACAVTADQLLHCWGGVGFQRTDLTPWVLP
jgi:alpha-tubulin suppressor-like RCC1 family protein